MRRSLVKLSGVVNDVSKMLTECLRVTKSCYACIIRLKRHLVKYEKYGTLSIYLHANFGLVRLSY